MLVCLMYFIEYIDRVNISVAAPLIKTELSLSNTQLGLVLSAFGWCYLAFQIIGGLAGDLFGARRTLTVLGLLWAAGTLLTGFVGGLASLFCARLLVGLGEAGTLPTASRVIAAWVPHVSRGFAQGFTHSAARLAAAVTPTLVVLMIPFIGWRGAFVVLGCVSLVWALAWFLYFRDDPRQHRGVKPAELALLPSFVAHGTRVGAVPWGRLAKRMLPVTLVFFCHAWTLWLYLSWLPSFFVQSYDMDIKRSALFSSGVFFAGMIGDTVGGLVTDAIYRHTGDLAKARRNTVIVGFVGSLSFLVAVLFVRDMTIIALLLAAALFFLEITEAPIWAVPIDVAPRYAGVASGMMSTAAGLAAVVSPLAFGIITDLTGSLRLPFVLSIMLLGVGVVLSFFMRPDRKLAEPEPAPQPSR
jgi:sugar phosphate permease